MMRKNTTPVPVGEFIIWHGAAVSASRSSASVVRPSGSGVALLDHAILHACLAGLLAVGRMMMTAPWPTPPPADPLPAPWTEPKGDGADRWRAWDNGEITRGGDHHPEIVAVAEIEGEWATHAPPHPDTLRQWEQERAEWAAEREMWRGRATDLLIDAQQWLGDES
jgi:hypothetical protein